MACHKPAKFAGHRYFGSGDIGLDQIGFDWNALFRVDKIVEKKSN